MPKRNFTSSFEDYDSLAKLSNAINDFAEKHACQPISTSIAKYELFGDKYSALVVFESTLQ